MKNIRIPVTAVMIAVCLALFAGCAGTGTGNNEAGNAGTGTVEPESDMQYIRDKGKITIGYTVFEPMNFTDANGNFTGFDTEFAVALCAKLGVEPDFVEINWDTKEVELEAKSIDCVWNGMTITPGRLEQMSISLPYLTNAQVIVVKEGGAVASTADLIGKTVVAEVGSAGEMQIIGGDDDPEENLAKANYIAMAKQTDCLIEVKAGTADACVLDLTLAKAMVGDGTDFSDLVIVGGIRLAEEEYGIAFRKGSDVTDIANGIMLELVRDGTLPALADKYELVLADAVSG